MLWQPGSAFSAISKPQTSQSLASKEALQSLPRIKISSLEIATGEHAWTNLMEMLQTAPLLAIIQSLSSRDALTKEEESSLSSAITAAQVQCLKPQMPRKLRMVLLERVLTSQPLPMARKTSQLQCLWWEIFFITL